MIILAACIAILLVILLIRVGVDAEYSSSGFCLKIKIGFIKLTLLPRVKKNKTPSKKKTKKKRKGAENKNAEKSETKKKGGSLKNLLELIPAITKALGRLRKRLVINELILHLVMAGDDPAETAINYGRANIALGSITSLLENAFRIKKRSFTADVSFLDTKTTVYCKAVLTIAIWALLYIAFGVAVKFIKIKLKSMIRKRKVEKTDGQTSDSGTDGNNNAENSRDG